MGMLCELLLNVIHELLGDAEGLAEHGIGERGVRAKERIGDCLDSRELAAQSGDGHRILFPYVLLEMHERLGEHEHVSLLQRLADEGVVSVNKPYKELAFR